MSSPAVHRIIDLLRDDIIAEFVPDDDHCSESVARVWLVTGPEHHIDSQRAIVIHVRTDPVSVWDTVASTSEGAALLIIGGAPPNQAEIEERGRLYPTTAMIWLTDSVDWADVIALCRSTATSTVAEAATGIPAGDLFVLVNTVSSLVGGATGIVDTAGRILAYSTNREHEIDEVRRRTTLTLVEDEPPDEDPEYAKVYGSADAILLDLTTRNTLPRAAKAIRHRGEILATIWVIANEPSRHSQICEILDAMEPVIAQHLSRALLVNRTDVERCSELLRTVLEAPEANSTSARLLGLTHDTRRVVVRFGFSDAFAPNQMRDLRRLLYIVGSHAKLSFTHVVVGLIGTEVVTLIDLRDGGSIDEIRRFAARMMTSEATSVSCPMVVGISDIATGVSGLRTANIQAMDTASAIERSRTVGSPGIVGSYSEWRSVIRLAYVTDVLRTSWLWNGDEIDALVSHDREHGTELVPTLRAYLRANGSIAEAASALVIHKNTVRYRLRRVEELYTVDLSDHYQRLWMWLRLESL